MVLIIYLACGVLYFINTTISIIILIITGAVAAVMGQQLSCYGALCMSMSILSLLLMLRLTSL